MSMGYSNRVWKCPFFRWDKREEIHCEDGHAKVFQHQRELAAWAREHCGKETGWEACPIAQTLLCPKDETNPHDEKGAHHMERNVDKIKRLEKELGRWQKKVRLTHGMVPQIQAGIPSTSWMPNTILRQRSSSQDWHSWSTIKLLLQVLQERKFIWITI